MAQYDMPKNKFYITTSIAYTNAPPHIGFALESIQADVLARYHRFLGDDVFFLTGTDEHGIKIAKTAKEVGRNPQDFVDEISAKFMGLKKVLNLSTDDFIRTTDKKRHWPAVEKVWKGLAEKGDIYKKKYKGLYCVGCETFVSERDLVAGKCPIHNKEPEIVEEENYFFWVSKYLSDIEKLIIEDKIKIIPETRKNEVLGIIKQGFEDVSFSRSSEKLQWGVPVPGDSSQTLYVWADALTNYISALGYGGKDKNFKKYWPADVHCIGKDILKFHTLIWPAMLLSLGLELPKMIFVHGFITSAGQKMSKSLGNTVDPFELVEKYGTDAVRYYLLREIPASEDGDFTYEKFEERYNSDLASGIGNLVARVTTMAEKINLKSKITNPKQIQNPKLKTAIDETYGKYNNALDSFKFSEALKAVWELIGFCDKYIEEEKPWENKSEELKVKNEKVIGDLLFALKNIAELLAPFLPETSEKILKQIKGKIKKGESLFPRIKDEKNAN
jgi:methionyl-tRNA synthetase